MDVECQGCENKNKTIAALQDTIDDLRSQIDGYMKKLSECRSIRAQSPDNEINTIKSYETHGSASELYASRIRERVLEKILPDLWRILIAEIKNFPITEGLTSGIPNNDLKGRIEDISGTLETVSPDDFASGVDLNRALEDYEKRLITHALTVTNGVKSQAAKFLNINRTTLIERMKRLGLGSTGDEHK